jgi:hypothetical protein
MVTELWVVELRRFDMTGTFIVGRNDSNSGYTTVAWICIPVHANTVIAAHFS